MNNPHDARLLSKSPFQSQENNVAGCLFILPARRRFVPNAWLLHAEGNQDGTRLVLFYSHCTVTIAGVNLLPLIEFLFSWELKLVQEGSEDKARKISVSRIDIEDKNGEG